MNTETIKERVYFGPSRFQEAIDTFKAITKQDIPVTTNFTHSEEIPRDHGLLIQPILERNKNKRGGPLQLTSYLVLLCPNCHWEFDNGLLSLVGTERLELPTYSLEDCCSNSS